jgi:hypothetical protein
VNQSAFRPLSKRERALLNLLLAAEFPGVRELRVQAESVRGRPWNGLATLLEFEVTDPQAPRAPVTSGVPVETEVRGADPPQELLLHVRRGLLDSMDLTSYDGEDPTELPDVGDLEVPSVNPPDR